jgi:hypothetical protein
VTAQVPDQVRWRDRSWTLAGIDGAGLFDPLAVGLRPVMLHTACWRGFICSYAVVGDRLRLEALEVGLDRETAALASEGRAPEIHGRQPTQQTGGVAWRYEDLALAVPFTGRLLLADGFIRELYVHMGFQPAWKYETVHELEFDDGRLLLATDRSAEMAATRAEATAQGRPTAGGSGPGSIIDWIKESFDRRYGGSRSTPPRSRRGRPH